MSNVDFAVLCEQAKAYAGFEPEDELVLVQEAPQAGAVFCCHHRILLYRVANHS